jgi:MoxR-like ATPase
MQTVSIPSENPWQRVAEAASSIILDKRAEIDLAITCILAGGHLLIEDVPGVGKTTLVQVLAKLLDLPYSRIQFTSDLLPADILGNSIYDPDKKSFYFAPGPLFAHLVLADELNRANPRTQSALLQAMEEGQVSVDRLTHALPAPFFLIATQNPKSQMGTFPLPESQLDRFLMSMSMNYTSYDSEVSLFQGQDPRAKLKELTPVVAQNSLRIAQEKVNGIRIAEPLARYIADLLGHTRLNQNLFTPLSTRSGLALTRAARARAFLQGRDFATPDDVQAIAAAVLSHRLGGLEGVLYGRAKALELIKAVAIPT